MSSTGAGSPILLLINGLPGTGKSTLARRFTAERPLALGGASGSLLPIAILAVAMVLVALQVLPVAVAFLGAAIGTDWVLCADRRFDSKLDDAGGANGALE